MIALFVLAIALAMDAFAVSVCQGAAARHGWREALRMGGAFGLAQGVMPALGWAFGVALAGIIEAIDHWIAFVLLGILGAKMIYEGFRPDNGQPCNALDGRALFTAAVATSIDAAAAGVTLPTLGLPVVLSCVVIAIVTGVLCVLGVLTGARLGQQIGKRAEIVGGLVLIALGTHTLGQHLGWF
ncbi:manganese efflux pump MntP family protein [Sphingomonas sp.]|uniref:manganese efflux pump MntP n=1 Tax=Sphingomonas sp. TaxID=28214 RepID=UPI0025D66E18|nr:manganese efflux pump MntP family protein [Sphingomonas sp.]